MFQSFSPGNHSLNASSGHHQQHQQQQPMQFQNGNVSNLYNRESLYHSNIKPHSLTHDSPQAISQFQQGNIHSSGHYANPTPVPTTIRDNSYQQYEQLKRFEFVSGTPRSQKCMPNGLLSQGRDFIQTPLNVKSISLLGMNSSNKLSEKGNSTSSADHFSGNSGFNRNPHQFEFLDSNTNPRDTIPRFSKAFSYNPCTSENMPLQFNDYDQQGVVGGCGSKIYQTKSNNSNINFPTNYNGNPSQSQQQQFEALRLKPQQQQLFSQQQTLSQYQQQQLCQLTPKRKIGQPPIAPMSNSKQYPSSNNVIHTSLNTPTSAGCISLAYGTGTQSNQKSSYQQQNQQLFYKQPSTTSPHATSSNPLFREPFKNMSNLTQGPTGVGQALMQQQLSPQHKLFDSTHNRNRFMGQNDVSHHLIERSLTPEQAMFLEKVNSVTKCLNQTQSSYLKMNTDQCQPSSSPTSVHWNNLQQRDTSPNRTTNMSSCYSGDFGQIPPLFNLPQRMRLSPKSGITNSDVKNAEEPGSFSYAQPGSQQTINNNTMGGRQFSCTKDASQMVYTDTSLFNFQNDKDQSQYSNNNVLPEREYQTYFYGSKDLSSYQTPLKPVNRQLNYNIEASATAGLSLQKPIEPITTTTTTDLRNMSFTTAFLAQQQNGVLKFKSGDERQLSYTDHLQQNGDSPRFNIENNDCPHQSDELPPLSIATTPASVLSRRSIGPRNPTIDSALFIPTKVHSLAQNGQSTPKQASSNIGNYSQSQSNQLTSEKIYQMIEEMRNQQEGHRQLPPSDKTSAPLQDTFTRQSADAARKNGGNHFIANQVGQQFDEKNNFSPVVSSSIKQEQIQRNNLLLNSSSTSQNQQKQIVSPSPITEKLHFNYMLKGGSPFQYEKIQPNEDAKPHCIELNMNNIIIKNESNSRCTQSDQPFSSSKNIPQDSSFVKNIGESPKETAASAISPIPPPRVTSSRFARQPTRTESQILLNKLENPKQSCNNNIGSSQGSYVPSLQAVTTVHLEQQIRDRERNTDRQSSQINRATSSSLTPIQSSAAAASVAPQPVIAATPTPDLPQQQAQSSKQPQPIEMTKELEKFSFGKVLGLGSYAVVRQVETDLGEVFALKTYEKKKLQDPQKRKNVAREVKILSKIKHDNIVRLYDVIETEFQLHLVMELPSQTPLNAFIKSQPQSRLQEDQARSIFTQLVQAIRYCHKKSVVHRDIKMENVLYDAETDKIKLIDFGFSIALAPTSKLNIFCGTPSYMAPEIVNKVEYTFPVDIWALGILLFKAINGTFPFRGHDDKELFKRINSCKLDFQPYVSQQARNLLSRILKQNPNERYTAEQILADEWMQMQPSKQADSKIA